LERGVERRAVFEMRPAIRTACRTWSALAPMPYEDVSGPVLRTTTSQHAAVDYDLDPLGAGDYIVQELPNRGGYPCACLPFW
jgi:hypothetical protein